MKNRWFLFMKVSGFFPFDTFIVQDGYVHGKNLAFKWRLKNVFFYFTDGYEHSFRGLKDMKELAKILRRDLNKKFAERVGRAIRRAADDFLRATKKAFKSKAALKKYFPEFLDAYASFICIFQTPQLAHYSNPEKDKKLLYQFGLSRDYAAKVLAKAENIYRPRLISLIGHKKALYLMPEEVKRYLKTVKLPADLNKRKTWAVLTANRQTKVYWNEAADKVFKKEYFDFVAKGKKTRLVTGQSAYQGKVIGRVYLALNDRQFKKVPKGAVLVCSMTRYTVAPYLRKVAAIVTDQGGITCHAAILAREFKVPTVIGTRNATNVFRTGDLVEVDADKGLVRIIKSPR